MHHADNLIITKENIKYARTLTAVGGRLEIFAENPGLTALTSVGGNLYISADNPGLTALTAVGGDLEIRANNAGMTALTAVGGNLYIYAKNAGLTALTAVGGGLKIRVENARLTALTTIGASLEIYAKNAGLTSLTSLGGKPFIEPSPEVAAQRLQAVAKAALATPDALSMSDWHCGASHSVEGWAIHLAGEEGYELERAVGAPNAGAMLLGLKAAEMFFLDDETARARLQQALVIEPSLLRPSSGL